MTDLLPLSLRKPDAGDLNLIFSSWLKSSLANPWLGQQPQPVYMYNAHRCIESLWNDATAAWLVACDPTMPAVIHGWLCGQQGTTATGEVPILHYLYVPKTRRRLGVASRLLSTFGIEKGASLLVTHVTPRWKLVTRDRDLVSVYSPWLFMARCPVPGVVPEIRSQREQSAHQKAVDASRRAIAVKEIL